MYGPEITFLHSIICLLFQVYDEIAKEYRPRFGYNKPLNPNEDWVMPDNPNELQKYGVQDPFELTKALKKKENEKIAKKEEANRKRKAGLMGEGKKQGKVKK